MKSVVRLGSGSGFWGDALDPAVELVERAELDYLSLDYLAELTMALLQRQRGCRCTIGSIAANVIVAIAQHLTTIRSLPARTISGDSRLANADQCSLVCSDADSVVTGGRIADHDSR